MRARVAAQLTIGQGTLATLSIPACPKSTWTLRTCAARVIGNVGSLYYGSTGAVLAKGNVRYDLRLFLHEAANGAHGRAVVIVDGRISVALTAPHCEACLCVELLVVCVCCGMRESESVLRSASSGVGLISARGKF